MSEATILNHYKINNPYPDAWPIEKDEDESSSDEDAPLSPRFLNGAARRSNSKYSVLGRHSSRTSVPGAERTKDGRDTLVQKDEADPLGAPRSVMQTLRHKGLPVEDDTKLRNRFLLSSTTFSPTLFLSQVHSTDSTESLLQGLDFLSRSIEQKSASLKVLVESNFERFVRAKATIDNVYTEMRAQGGENDSERPGADRRHSRQLSKNAQHFKRLSSGFNGAPPASSAPERKKNALVKEMEYGVQPIKAPLLELTVKAEEVWGPALGGKEREDGLKALLGTMDRVTGVFQVSTRIHEAISQRDFQTVADQYDSAQRYASDAKTLVDRAAQSRQQLSDSDLYQIVATARMWSEIEEQISTYKRELRHQLARADFVKPKSGQEDRPEEYLELIGVLQRLGADEDPVSSWLFGRLDVLKTKLHASVERSKVEIEILRRRLASGEKPSSRQLALHLRNAETESKSKSGDIDSTRVIEVWDHTLAVLRYLLNHQGGLLGELIEFWDIARSFEDGRAQKRLPNAGASNWHQQSRLSRRSLDQLSTGISELLSYLREGITSLFCDAPVDDLSMLLSPIPDTPDVDTPRTPLSATLATMTESHLRVDAANLPAMSPRSGEYWEKYAFWPPHSNSLSGVRYLSRIISLIGTAASDMASINLTTNPTNYDHLKTFVGSVRERCVQALCSSWSIDADNSKVLEDWTRAQDRTDLTKMPARMMAFEGFLLTNLQKVLFLDDNHRQSNGVGTKSTGVVVPPSQKLLQLVRTQFSSSIYKILSGMVENAEHLNTFEETWGNTADHLSTALSTARLDDDAVGGIDYASKSVRLLLTLSNIQSIRNEIVPHLITQFETSFNAKLVEETGKIRDALGQIDARLFQSYVSPVATQLDTIIKNGIASPTWEPATARPPDAQPYVYSVLLSLVAVHSEVSTTAAPLTSPILKYLLEQLSTSLITAFRLRSRYTLPALMQATLDVEFLAQTLNNYTTDRASEVQSAIYIALDERTDNEARMRLQEELQEMRAILKRLREGTKVEFACFKRQRSHARTTDGRSDSRAGATSRGN